MTIWCNWIFIKTVFGQCKILEIFLTPSLNELVQVRVKQASLDTKDIKSTMTKWTNQISIKESGGVFDWLQLPNLRLWQQSSQTTTWIVAKLNNPSPLPSWSSDRTVSPRTRGGHRRPRPKNTPKRSCSTWSWAREQFRRSAWSPRPDFRTWSAPRSRDQRVWEDSPGSWSRVAPCWTDLIRTSAGCSWSCAAGPPWR